ncbi:hypothetical protein MUN89_03130 [Halobacillus salinarum]|uniref:Uncharacterized protein n=1 Tax=Halobacillus salinarum TaxID=2932257 RepID=A0ABY4ELC1_9BACI|nr:hypothetical protein [Halobacillus salinarum]UOQ44959.1 hypothetical protein MUN89_03130 [Halobacillus salinarum]
MRNWMYVVYAIVLGLVSIFTGEFVTFIMLGFILISLQNINLNLKKLLKQKQE